VGRPAPSASSFWGPNGACTDECDTVGAADGAGPDGGKADGGGADAGGPAGAGTDGGGVAVGRGGTAAVPGGVARGGTAMAASGGEPGGEEEGSGHSAVEPAAGFNPVAGDGVASKTTRNPPMDEES